MPSGGEPALPAIRAAQLLDGLLDEGAVGGAALLALGVGERGALGLRARGHGGVLLSVGVGARRCAGGAGRAGSDDGVDEFVELAALGDDGGAAGLLGVLDVGVH